MAKLLSNPKLLTIAIVFGILSIAGLAGGALGNEFGGGFLSTPIAHIQLAAEDITGELVGGFAITNTMLATWITILVLTGFAFFSTRRMSLVPRGLQNLAEAIIEGFLNLAQSVAGPENGRRFFPLAMTIFLFIVMANWLGILPGYGTIGRIETAEHIIAEAKHEAEENGEVLDLEDISLTTFAGGTVALVPFGSEEITAAEYQADPEQGGRKSGRLVPFLRSANTDLNTTLAIALVAMFMIQLWGIRSLGLSR
ncbi:MAG: F0F1 ATP synthase subunit A, partial [Planctomycetes bacterium]|nr:F0F1 ATP synthase subunit A [Planctomycetota bacterium]